LISPYPIERLNSRFRGEIIMNAKEFDTMEADLKYRKHLKYSESDMDEKLREQRQKYLIQLDGKQAKIDMLMEEYCPDEMT
jgi:hypothetical protein